MPPPRIQATLDRFVSIAIDGISVHAGGFRTLRAEFGVNGEFADMGPLPVARLFMAPVIQPALWQNTFPPIESMPRPPGAVLSLRTALFLRATASETPR